MKTLFKKIAFFGLIGLVLGIADASFSAPIFFDGPKITNKHVGGPLDGKQILFPENFAVWDYRNTNSKNDVSVPLLNLLKYETSVATYVAGAVLSLDNMDPMSKWAANIENSYFTQQIISDPGNPVQVLEANFDGNATKDLLILNGTEVFNTSFVVCLDYKGDAPVPCSAPVPIPSGDPTYPLIPMMGVVADFDGDGIDDFAIAGYTKPLKGYIVQYKGSPTPTWVSTNETPNGIPLSIDAGNLVDGAEQDVVVGVMPITGPAAFVMVSKNSGGTLQAPTTAVTLTGICYQPTGIVAYDGNGDSKSDAVVSCYTKTSGVLGMGTVSSLKSDAASPVNFSVQQTIDLAGPYSSAVGDLNGDGKPDLAVAETTRKKVTTIPGTTPFNFDTASKWEKNVSPYTPKFIQAVEMNGDGNPDLVVTASRPMLPQGFSIASDDVRGEYVKAKSFAFDVAVPAATQGYLFAGPATEIESVGFDGRPYVQSTYRQVAANQFEYNWAASKDSNNYRSAAVFSTDGITESVRRDSNAQALTSLSHATDKPKIQHGVLVFVNYRPNIIPEDPTCDSMVIHCIPSTGHTIDQCNFATAEAWGASANPQVTANGSGKDVRITLPKNTPPVALNFTVTAIENMPGGNTYTGTFTVTPPVCPPPPTTGGSVCPESLISAEVWVDDPWVLSLPTTTAQAVNAGGVEVIWHQPPGGPQILGVTDGTIVANTVTTTGPTLRGRFGWPEQDRTIDILYDLRDTTTGTYIVKDCVGRVFQKAALIEGSGKCSLGGGSVSLSNMIATLGAFLVPLSSLYFVRRKRREK